MYRKILVPVDFSPKNRSAIETASGFAASTGGELLLLHVIEKLEDDEGLETFYARLEQRARKQLAELETEARGKGAAPVSRLTYGNRVERIVKIAAEEEADLIVLASHRIDPESPRRDWLTISYRVALLAPCPVLLVK